MCATFSSYLFNPITTFLPLFSRKRHAWAFWKFDLDFLHDEARRSRRREVVPRRPSGLDPEDRLPGRVSPAAEAGSLGPVPFGRSNFSESGVEGALPDGRLLAYVVSESLPAPAIVAGTCSGF